MYVYIIVQVDAADNIDILRVIQVTGSGLLQLHIAWLAWLGWKCVLLALWHLDARLVARLVASRVCVVGGCVGQEPGKATTKSNLLDKHWLLCIFF